MAYLLSVGWTGIPIKEIDKINPWFYTQKGIILERNINETTKKYEDTNTSADWEDWRLYMVGQSHFSYDTFNFNGTVTVFTNKYEKFFTMLDFLKPNQKSPTSI